MMKTTKVTWTGDVKVALEAVGAEFYGLCFNDRHLTCRRLKFNARLDTDNGGELTDDHLAEMQRVIQDRRPDLNVTVSRWLNGRKGYKGWAGFGNVVVYYRPKTGLYMNHKVA